MAGKYIESSTPIMQNGDFYYPLTTAKQTILPDGRRLVGENGLNITADDVNALSIDLTNVGQGTATGINADTLGGKAPSQYALVADCVRATVEEFEYGEVPLTKADIAEMANSANEAVHAQSAANADHAIEADSSDNARMLENHSYQDVINNAENQTKANADTSVIDGSANLVTSGAVYNAIYPEKQYIPLTMANGATVAEPYNSYYTISNGWCLVNMAGITAPTNTASIITNLPKAARRANTVIRIHDSYPIFYIDPEQTHINVTVPFSNNLYLQLIYPIAEE